MMYLSNQAGLFIEQPLILNPIYYTKAVQHKETATVAHVTALVWKPG